MEEVCCVWLGSNPWPSDYEPDAQPTMLNQGGMSEFKTDSCQLDGMEFSV